MCRRSSIILKKGFTNWALEKLDKVCHPRNTIYGVGVSVNQLYTWDFIQFYEITKCEMCIKVLDFDTCSRVHSWNNTGTACEAVWCQRLKLKMGANWYIFVIKPISRKWQFATQLKKLFCALMIMFFEYHIPAEGMHEMLCIRHAWIHGPLILSLDFEALEFIIKQMSHYS